jgi:hypothetical protein
MPKREDELIDAKRSHRESPLKADAKKAFTTPAALIYDRPCVGD